MHKQHCRFYHRMSKLFLRHNNILPNKLKYQCKSHMLMLYNDIIQEEHSGTYYLLPMGQRALEKLIVVVDVALSKIGAQKLTMPCLTSGSLWKKSGRWNLMSKELFRLVDRRGSNLCLGPTHEESVTSLVASHSPLSRDTLPLLLYQITTKFRDEMYPKYGLLRGQEFLMKDMYTFDADIESAKDTYKHVYDCYVAILNTLGLSPVVVEADTGEIGGISSHEFHIISDAGEGRLMLCKSCGEAYSAEICEGGGPVKERHHCKQSDSTPDIIESRGIEVCHAFLLGDRYSSKFEAYYERNHQRKFLEMGCYGIGISRLLQASVQALSTDEHLRWPLSIAPYRLCIIPQKSGTHADRFFTGAEKLANSLDKINGLETDTVIDDRMHLSAGRRLNDARQRGFPFSVVVNKPYLSEDPKFEVIDNYRNETRFLSLNDAVSYITLDDGVQNDFSSIKQSNTKSF